MLSAFAKLHHQDAHWKRATGSSHGGRERAIGSGPCSRETQRRSAGVHEGDCECVGLGHCRQDSAPLGLSFIQSFNHSSFIRSFMQSFIRVVAPLLAVLLGIVRKTQFYINGILPSHPPWCAMLEYAVLFQVQAAALESRIRAPIGETTLSSPVHCYDPQRGSDDSDAV